MIVCGTKFNLIRKCLSTNIRLLQSSLNHIQQEKLTRLELKITQGCVILHITYSRASTKNDMYLMQPLFPSPLLFHYWLHCEGNWLLWCAWWMHYKNYFCYSMSPKNHSKVPFQDKKWLKFFHLENDWPFSTATFIDLRYIWKFIIYKSFKQRPGGGYDVLPCPNWKRLKITNQYEESLSYNSTPFKVKLYH